MKMPRLTNDVILFLAWVAARRFGGNDGVFNSASFGQVLLELVGVTHPADGLWPKLILSGRPGIQQKGESHWRLYEAPSWVAPLTEDSP